MRSARSNLWLKIGLISPAPAPIHRTGPKSRYDGPKHGRRYPKLPLASYSRRHPYIHSSVLARWVFARLVGPFYPTQHHHQHHHRSLGDSVRCSAFEKSKLFLFDMGDDGGMGGKNQFRIRSGGTHRPVAASQLRPPPRRSVVLVYLPDHTG